MIFLTLLLACQGSPADPAPTAPAASEWATESDDLGLPPPPRDLVWYPWCAISGYDFTQKIYEGTPGDEVAVYITRQTTGRRACPAALGGECLDLKRPVHLVSAATFANDGESMAWAIFPTAQVGDEYRVQAVSRGPGGVRLSPARTIRVLDMMDDPDADFLENGMECTMWGMHPYRADTDGDGVEDGVELYSGSLPWDPTDTLQIGCYDGDRCGFGLRCNASTVCDLPPGCNAADPCAATCYGTCDTYTYAGFP